MCEETADNLPNSGVVENGEMDEKVETPVTGVRICCACFLIFVVSPQGEIKWRSSPSAYLFFWSQKNYSVVDQKNC